MRTIDFAHEWKYQHRWRHTRRLRKCYLNSLYLQRGRSVWLLRTVIIQGSGYYSDCAVRMSCVNQQCQHTYIPGNLVLCFCTSEYNKITWRLHFKCSNIHCAQICALRRRNANSICADREFASSLLGALRGYQGTHTQSFVIAVVFGVRGMSKWQRVVFGWNSCCESAFTKYYYYSNVVM